MAVLGNVWRRFIDLLPKTPRYVATVTTVLSPGRYNVTLVGGGQLTVLGPTGYVVNDHVFVADKKIEGKAPALTAEVIEV